MKLTWFLGYPRDLYWVTFICEACEALTTATGVYITVFIALLHAAIVSGSSP
jgi:hypothetical protein